VKKMMMTMMMVAARKVVQVAAKALALVDVVAVAQAIAMMVAPLTAGMVVTVGRSNKSCIEGTTGTFMVSVAPQLNYHGRIWQEKR
jgi:hypothetical protein